MPRIEMDIKLDYRDVLIKPRRSTLKSRSEVDLECDLKMQGGRSWKGVPVVSANMDTTGTIATAIELAKHKCMTALNKFLTVEDYLALQKSNPEVLPYVAVSAGTAAYDTEMLSAILTAVPEVKVICLDVANGYSESFVAHVATIRKMFPEHVLIAGNVCTRERVEALLAQAAEQTEELCLNGADIVKVGIGPGSVCTTRSQTGVGYPQLSAVLECGEAARGLGCHVMADGGCTCPGDVAKAFGAGASFVMLGGMLGGHDESGGKLVERDGRKYKMFYGMSSSTAMLKHKGEVAEYRSSEGKTVEVPYKGPIRGTILSVLGGLRSSCTYVGAPHLDELSTRTTFIRVQQTVNPIYAQLKTDRSHGYKKSAGAGAGAGDAGAATGGAAGGEGGK